jgi:hypothetical protein
MSSTVVQSSNFDTSNVTFSQVKTLDGVGARQCYLNYGGRSLIFQTASMSVPYGMNTFEKEGTKPKYSVDLSFRGYEDASNKKVRAFYEAMSNLDKYMIEQGVKNSQAWFKVKHPREVVEAFYTPCVRVAKDANGNLKQFPPTVKINLKQRKDTDVFDVQCYDDQKRPYENTPVEELLVKGAQVTCLIQCTGVWFAGSKFGLSWKMVQIKVDKLPEAIRGFAFADEDGEATEAAPVTARRPAAKQVIEDDQVDDDEVFDDAPAPAPAVSKKSVLSAVTAPAPAPAPAPAQTIDDEAEDAEPIQKPAPKKEMVTKKKIISTKK